MPDGGADDAFFANLIPNPEVKIQPLTIPLEDVLDWKSILDNRRKNGRNVLERYYIVAFRSIRSVEADNEKLYAADALAHAEAKKSGGLLRYWYGTLNDRRECFAMCIWESREQSLAALHLPAHQAAMSLGEQMYKSYTLERYWLTAGPDGDPIFERLPSSIYGIPHKHGIDNNEGFSSS